jgi:hypothetical protein
MKTAVLRLCRVYDAREIAADTETPRTYYETKSLYPHPRGIEVWVNHDGDQKIGRVNSQFIAEDYVDGAGMRRWHMAEITGDLPGWVKRGVGVSIGTKGQHSYNVGAVTIMGRGVLEEVSVLTPGLTPANRGARVCYVRDSTPPAARSSAAGVTSGGSRRVESSRRRDDSPLRRTRSPSLILMSDEEFSGAMSALERVGVAPVLVDRASRFKAVDISTLVALIDEGFDADELSRLIYENNPGRVLAVR